MPGCGSVDGVEAVGKVYLAGARGTPTAVHGGAAGAAVEALQVSSLDELGEHAPNLPAANVDDVGDVAGGELAAKPAVLAGDRGSGIAPGMGDLSLADDG